MTVPFRQTNFADDEPAKVKTLIDNAMSVLSAKGASFAPYAGITIDLKPADIDFAGNLIKKKGHNFIVDDVVNFTTNGTLFAPVVAGTDYWVIASGLTDDAYKISATQGGPEIDFTDGGVGLHVCTLKAVMQCRSHPGKIPVVDAMPTKQGTQRSLVLVAPVTDPRNDIMVIDSSTGVLSVIAGAENASPVDPAITSGKLPIGRIKMYVGMTAITNNDIDEDLREDLKTASNPASASETAEGLIEIATQTETNTGTDNDRAVTPLKLKANLASPPPIGSVAENTGKFTSIESTTTLQLANGTTANEISIDGTFGGNSDDAVPTEKAAKTFIAAQIAAIDTSPADGSISQAKLKSTTADNTKAANGITMATLTGGEYSFWITVKNSTTQNNDFSVAPVLGVIDNGSSQISTSNNLTTTLTSRITMSVYGGGGTMTVRHRYIQSSPPYDLGDGEVQGFIQALIENGTGKILAMSHGDDPVWANNGPTCINPEYVRDGKFYRKRCVIDRLKDFENPERYSSIEQEITPTFKNSDMALIPHPFLGNDLTGQSVIMIDPNDPIVERARIMRNAGESALVELFHNDYVRFGNTHLSGRKTPSSEIMVVKPTWKNTGI